VILIVDYGRGNLFSIGQALKSIGVEFCISQNPDDLRNASAVILPGVGAFGDAMVNLNDKEFVEPLKRYVDAGKPLLGICLGMQLLFESSDEFGVHAGLNLLPGKVSRLPEPDQEHTMRIPNVGWRQLQVNSGNPFGKKMTDHSMVYFVHSFAPQPTNTDHIAATTRVNGKDIAVAVNMNNIYGCQFHPEKSGPEGLNILRKFTESIK